MVFQGKRALLFAVSAVLIRSTVGVQKEEYLRKNKSREKDDRSDKILEPLVGTTDEDEMVERVVVKCEPEEDFDTCLERVETAVPPDSIKVLHRLRSSNSVALSIKSSARSDFQIRGFDLHDDPIRQPLYLKESVQIQRDLQYEPMQSTPYGITMVNAPSAWQQFGTQGEGVKVCVMDTGLDADHTDLSAPKLTGYSGNEAVTPWDVDTSGHGTHVTGTIAAADNNKGVVGVAPEVEIYTVRVFDSQGYFYGSDVVAAAEACQDAGADVISMSLGGPIFDAEENALFSQLRGEGIISVAAAGNSGGNDKLYPAAYGSVVSVAAVDSNGNRASFSTKNNQVDVAAPGVNIRSTWNNGQYAEISGTSMACPHVSGVVALMKSYKPSATYEDIIYALYVTAENPNTQGRDNLYGHGVVDAVAALSQLDGGGGNGGGSNGGGNNGGGSGGSNEEGNSGGCVDIEVTVNTDRYGWETSHSLVSTIDGVVYWDRDRLGNNREYVESACLDPSGCYRYEISDSYGDGIFGEGIELKYDNKVVYSGGNFGYGGYRDFGNGCS